MSTVNDLRIACEISAGRDDPEGVTSMVLHSRGTAESRYADRSRGTLHEKGFKAGRDVLHDPQTVTDVTTISDGVRTNFNNVETKGEPAISNDEPCSSGTGTV